MDKNHDDLMSRVMDGEASSHPDAQTYLQMKEALRAMRDDVPESQLSFARVSDRITKPEMITIRPKKWYQSSVGAFLAIQGGAVVVAGLLFWALKATSPASPVISPADVVANMGAIDGAEATSSDVVAAPPEQPLAKNDAPIETVETTTTEVSSEPLTVQVVPPSAKPAQMTSSQARESKTREPRRKRRERVQPRFNSNTMIVMKEATPAADSAMGAPSPGGRAPGTTDPATTESEYQGPPVIISSDVSSTGAQSAVEIKGGGDVVVGG